MLRLVRPLNSLENGFLLRLLSIDDSFMPDVQVIQMLDGTYIWYGGCHATREGSHG